MLQRNNNTLSCPDCGRSWHFMGSEGLVAGDCCPSDDCPSNEKTPIGIINGVCHDFDANGISSVGAIAALKAMSRHWKDHLAEGHNPKIISDDIDEMTRLLKVMRAEIMRRILEQPINYRPFCFTEDGVTVNGRRCFDLSVAEELFGDELTTAENATNDRFEQYLRQSEALFGEINAQKYEALVESFINIVVKSCCATV